MWNNQISKKALGFFSESGLAKEQAQKMKIKDLDARELKKLFPKMRFSDSDLSGHEIPYFDLSGESMGFARYRLHDDSGTLPKYLQVTGQKSRFYFPPFVDWEKIAIDPSIPIYITEGERKAAKACVMGFPCIGLGGVWNWLSKGEGDEERSQLIKDFQLIEWKNRDVIIVFDSDSQFNTNVQDAIRRLRDSLVNLGANPYKKDLPHKAGSGKVGLDDFLKAKGGKRNFTKLPCIPLLLNQTISGLELLKKQFKPTQWIVKGLVPAGLTILAGPPKVGKSWLVLALILSAAAGKKALGHYETEAMNCFYLALEDSPKRLKNRIQALCAAGYGINDRSHFAYEWERVRDGGLAALERRLDENPNCKAVFIDTFAKMRNAPRGRESLYHEDYEAVSVLKRIADQRGIGIIVVHHTKKGATEDFLESVSGSSGITGAADTIIVLRRNRNEQDGTLYVTGRDVGDQAIALAFENGTWIYKGEASAVHATETQQEILGVMKAQGRPLRQKELADLTGRKNAGFTKTLARMERDNLVKRENGFYAPVEKPPQKFAQQKSDETGTKE